MRIQKLMNFKNQHRNSSSMALMAILFVILIVFCGLTFYFVGINTALASSANSSDVYNCKLIDHLAVKSLTLIDNNNTTRAQLNITEEGSLGLAFFDSNHKQRLSVLISNETSAIVFSNRNENKRIVIGEDNANNTGIAIYSMSGKILFGIKLDDNENPFLGMCDNTGRARHGIGIKNGIASYLMLDKSGTKANLLFVKDNGASGLSVGTNSQSSPLAFIGMYDGAPVMTLKDKHNAKVFAGFGKNTGGMLSVQEHGREIWHAGVQGQAPAAEIDVTDLLK